MIIGITWDEFSRALILKMRKLIFNEIESLIYYKDCKWQIYTRKVIIFVFTYLFSIQLESETVYLIEINSWVSFVHKLFYCLNRKPKWSIRKSQWISVNNKVTWDKANKKINPAADYYHQIVRKHIFKNSIFDN